MSERIIGIGFDLIENKRISDAIEKHGDRFLHRIFHRGEIDYSQKSKISEVHFAARFAAKEAVSKAFGTGIGEKLGWRDIEVARHPHGEPYLILHGKGLEMAKSLGVTRSLISLTHTKDYAAAQAILIGG